MAKITYANKVTLNPQPSIADENKVTDDDMNEIKDVVNNNDDNTGDLSNLATTDKSSLVNAINEVNSSATGIELWRNNTPSSAITTLTINLTNANYDELDIWFYDHKDYKKLYKQTLLKGHNTILYCIEVNGGFYRRNLTRTNDTKYSLGAGYFGSNTTNNVIIPLLIIGKKTGASLD